MGIFVFEKHDPTLTLPLPGEGTGSSSVEREIYKSLPLGRGRLGGGL